jgi:hypothetical protein
MEHGHQMALFCACSLYMVDEHCEPEVRESLRWYHAIPNGGSRGVGRNAALVGAQLKAEGVRSGVSDTFLPVPRHGYCGFYIELKRHDGKESDNQKEFARFVQQQGYLYLCANHWSKAFRGLMWYLGFEHTQDWELPNLGF